MQEFNTRVALGRLATGFVALALWLPLVTAAAPAAFVNPEDTPLTARDGTAFMVTRGRVRVPELHMAPGGAAIELAVVRIRRAGTAAAGRVHVLLAGGPGDSGVRQALDLARQGGAALAEFIDGDLVGIDQRGAGGSIPNLRATARYGLPLDQPASVAAWLPLAERAARTVAAEMRGRGIRLEAYNTEESAVDVDAVRESLGYERMTLWGRSYGTHLALAVARRHPDRVERMVLVSPEGPDHTRKLPSQVDRVLQRIGERAGAPGMAGQLRTVVDKLAQAPVPVEVRDPATGRDARVVIGAMDLQWAIAQAIGDPRAIATLPAAVQEMSAGDFQRVAPLILMLRRQLGIDSAMKHMMDLSSGASAARMARIEREAGSALLGDAMNFPARHLYAAWNARPLEDAFGEPVTVAVPTLLLVGDLDARTPLENAQEIAASLPQAQLVVVENAAHQFDVFGNAAIRTLLGRFVRGEAGLGSRIALPPLRFEGAGPLRVAQ